jgi:hypothetical protein
MASQTNTAPKRATKPPTKGARTAARNKSTTSTNGDRSATRTKPTSEMTLEELSLRAYKMTYERLHGSKTKKK